ncbi:MAG: isocitrate dehydrogenase kinase/phosphatase AceK regulatory subunit, partial [Gemmatimonadaceae bacterium]
MYSTMHMTGKGPSRALARPIGDLYYAFRERFDAITALAPGRFMARDWHAAQRDAAERLAIYKAHIDQALSVARAQGGELLSATAWRETKLAYAAATAGRADAEIAATFFNSVTRRLFSTIGVDPETEFTDTDSPLPDDSARAEVRVREFAEMNAGAARWALERGPWSTADEPAAADTGVFANALDAALAGESGAVRLEMLDAVFYRNKGAYLVGRATRGSRSVPLIVAMLNGKDGVCIDAVLTTSDEASVVFGFSW